jgi:hypothetical protein
MKGLRHPRATEPTLGDFPTVIEDRPRSPGRENSNGRWSVPGVPDKRTPILLRVLLVLLFVLFCVGVRYNLIGTAA